MIFGTTNTVNRKMKRATGHAELRLELDYHPPVRYHCRMAATIKFLETDSARLDIAVCRKTAELYSEGKRVCIYAPTQAEAQLIDALLWNFDDQSFIPHQLAGCARGTEDQVAVTAEPCNPNGAQVLIVGGAAQGETVAGLAGIFEEVIDFVPKASASLTEKARERFRVLRDSGLPVTFIPLGR